MLVLALFVLINNITALVSRGVCNLLRITVFCKFTKSEQ